MGLPAILDAPHGAFTMEVDARDDLVLNLLLSPPGIRAAPTVIWTRRFDTVEERSAVFEAIYGGTYDLVFLGHLTMSFGGAELDAIIDQIVRDAHAARTAAAQKAAKAARNHQLVQLFTRDTKRGYVLELQRRSRDAADWSVRYDRASERDRLCDWLRWQTPRFLDFLDHAASQGDEALTRLLIDEMFQTERRVKQEGRGAGGMRPLRMWRGD